MTGWGFDPFEALTGEAFDRQNGNMAGNLTKIFQKSQMPRGLPENMVVRSEHFRS